MVNVIKETFGLTIKKAGFQKKSDSGYLRTDETVLVVNLQKSSYGYQYYVNLGVWLNTLGVNTFPKGHHCHIRLRAVALDRERQRYWENEVFNLDNTDITDTDRGSLIQSFLEDTAIPFLLSCGSLDSLRKMKAEGRIGFSAGIPLGVVALSLLEDTE